jgi:DNA-binding NarL/FixJ family response regulator
MTVKILIADDHAVVRDGLRMILGAKRDLSVIGTAASGREAVAKAEALRPDVILMDIAMPDLNGIEATRVISEADPSIRVVILSMYHTSEYVFRAAQAGARGYLLKESAGTEVVKAVRTVMEGKNFFGKGVERPPEGLLAQDQRTAKSPLDSLSIREKEVLQLVVEGKTSVEIAETLALSPKSVETYRSRLMKKLSVKNIPSLVMFAIQHGITPVH